MGRDPPVFSAGSTGKSLITLFSIRHRIGGDKTTGVLPLQVLPFVGQKPKCGSGAGLCTSFRQSVGQGYRLDLGNRVKRTVRFGIMELPAAVEGERINPSGSYSLVGAPGRNISILAEQARASRDHAPGFLWRWKPW